MARDPARTRRFLWGVGVVLVGAWMASPVAARAQSADLSATLSGPATAGENTNYTYSIVVVNSGPSTATGVVVTNVLPAGVAFVAAGSYAGCANNGGTVVCSVGTLGSGASVTVPIVANAPFMGTARDVAAVIANELDPNVVNNSQGSPLTTTISCATITVAPAPASLPPTVLGSAFSQTFTASGGSGAYTFTETGTLPTGLTWSGASLSGTPSAAGQWTFTIQAKDALNCTGSQTYTVRVCGTITITQATLAAGAVGTAYSQTLTSTGGVGGYTYGVTSGALPAGLSLAGATGVISGTPQVSGTSTFTVQSTDSIGCVGTRSYTITISGAGAAAFYTLAPCRAVDTRISQGAFGLPALQPNATRAFPLAGRCSIPSAARAVAVNVVVLDGTAGGSLTAYPGGVTQPGTSTINFGVAQTRANNAIIPVSLDGTATLNFLNSSTGTVNLIIDVVGYFQ